MSQEQQESARTTDPPTVVAPSDVPVVAARSSYGTMAGPLGLPRAYWLLWAGMLLNRLGGGVFVFLSIYLTRERGLPAELAGMVVGLYAGGGMVAGPVGGVLADRVGRRATLLLGTASAGGLMLALGLARTTATIVVLAPLLGFCTDLCRPPLQAAVADLVPAADRRRAYGFIYWAINLGFAGAAALGGALAEHSFGLLFVIDALTTLAYGAIVFLGVPETRPAPSSPPTARAAGALGLVRPLFEPFADHRYLAFVGIQLLLFLSFAQVVVALPLDMKAHGLPTAQIGLQMGLNGAVIVVAQPLLLRLAARVAHVTWLAVGTALTGVGLGLVALAGAPLVYALACVVWTLGEIGFSAAAPTLISDLAPEDRRGAYQGTYQLAWGLAMMVAPTLGSLVLTRVGPSALWLGCLGLCGAATLLHLTVTARWNQGYLK